MSLFGKYKLGSEGPLGETVKEIIIQTDNIIIYMDGKDTIQWYTEGYENFDENFGEIQNKVSDWELKVNKLFNKKDAYGIKTILAEAYGRILDGKDIKLARDIIERAINTIQKQGSEILRQYYSISTVIFTILIAIFIFISKCNKVYILREFGRDEYNIWMTMLFGGIGAFIFTSIRLKDYKPDIVVSKTVHILDGILRIFYGLIAGLIIALAVKSNVAFGFLNQIEKGIYLYVFLGICAGASEIIIPNLIKQVEIKSSK